MTRDEILNMPAGREMDALMGNLLGYTWIDTAWGYKDSGVEVALVLQDDGVWMLEPNQAYLWRPSKKYEDAWLVVEFIKHGNIGSRERFELEIQNVLGHLWIVTELTPALICRAALLSVMEAS